MRPSTNDYAPSHAGYVDLVPEEDILDAMERQTVDTQKVLSSLDDTRAEHRYAEGKWSIKEVLGHLIDAERVFGYRAMAIARGEQNPLPGFDENEYVRNASFDAWKLGDLVEAYALMRRSNVLFFRNLSKEAWDRRGGKAVEIGEGVRAAMTLGSHVHDAIGYEKGEGKQWAGFTRPSNHAGGIEGGISNGKDVIVRGYLKPISTLRRPLPSVDFETREQVEAAYERSDVCVVPAAGVAAEAMVAITIAGCALDKFGGDSMTETRRNFEGYCQQLRNY